MMESDSNVRPMKRVALINMPWNSVSRGSLALGLIKRVLRRHKIPADVFYFNIRLAARMNLPVYEKISEQNLFGDWLFSQHLFGQYGTAELPNSYHDIASDRLHLFERSASVKMMIDRTKINFDEILKIIPVFLDECLTSVSWEDYVLVGFTSVFAQHASSLLFAKKIKERFPAIKIAIGGANVHGPMGKAALRAFDWIDYVVDAEAEETFPRLIKNLLEGKPYERLPGISFRKQNEVVVHQELPSMVDMNRLPIPDYSEYFQELDRSKLKDKIRPVILFESARGCWWGEKSHCTFCGLNGQLMKFRSKRPGRVLHEIGAQMRRHNTFLFEATDNILDMNYFSTFLPRLAEIQEPLELFYEVKANLKRHHVDLLRSGKIKFIQPGIESLHSDVLQLMRKGVSAIQNIQLLKWCRERDIHISWNMLYGFPAEKRSHYDEILNRIRLITHLYPPTGVSRIDVQRFSPYYLRPEKWGIRNIRPMALYYYIYPESRVNLDNLAYHFDYSLPPGQENPECYIRPIAEAIEEWQKAYQELKIAFQVERLDGGLQIRDSRLDENCLPAAERVIVLRGLSASVYEYCESIRSFNEIYQNCTNRVEGKEKLERILEQLVLEKLVFKEGDRYLSLALCSWTQKGEEQIVTNREMICEGA